MEEENSINNNGSFVEPNSNTHPAIRSVYSRISNDSRKVLINMVCEQGTEIGVAAKSVGIKYITAWKIISKYERTGQTDKKEKTGRVVSVLTDEVKLKIEEIVERNPEFTISQIQALVKSDLGITKLSKTSVDRCLNKLKITMKKAHRELDKVNEPLTIEKRRSLCDLV